MQFGNNFKFRPDRSKEDIEGSKPRWEAEVLKKLIGYLISIF